MGSGCIKGCKAFCGIDQKKNLTKEWLKKELLKELPQAVVDRCKNKDELLQAWCKQQAVVDRCKNKDELLQAWCKQQMLYVVHNQDKMIRRVVKKDIDRKLIFRDMTLTLMDVENLMCEFSKYKRGSAKVKFNGDPNAKVKYVSNNETLRCIKEKRERRIFSSSSRKRKREEKSEEKVPSAKAERA